MHIISRKFVTRFLVVSIMAAALSVISGSVYACVGYLGTLSDGSTAWIHCNTSAGNFVTACPPEGLCDDITTPDMQEDIDTLCRNHPDCNNLISNLHIGKPTNATSGQIRPMKRFSVPVQTAGLCTK
jgi:hypothetical protein